MGLNKEFESLRIRVEADRAVLSLSKNRKATGPLGFMERCFPIRLGSILTSTTTYLFERLVSGYSPEEITRRSQSLIRIFGRPSNS